MTFLKSTLAILGLTFALAACEPVPVVNQPGNAGTLGARQFVAMNQVFEKYTPLSFKATRLPEMRQQLKAGGYQIAHSKRDADGKTRELWRGVITRGGKNVSATRVRITSCPNSSIVEHSRTTLDDMHASFAREVQAFVRARKDLILIDERRKQGGDPLHYILINADRPDGRKGSDVPRGEIIYGLGGVRVFDNGDRRVGITIRTSCG